MGSVAQDEGRVKGAGKAEQEQAEIVPADERLKLFQDVTIVPNDLIRHPSLSPGAKTLWMILWSYCWRGNTCFPGLKRVAEQMAVSLPTLMKYRKELERGGLLRVTRRGHTRTNLYELYAPAYQSPQEGDEKPLENDDVNTSLNHDVNTSLNHGGDGNGLPISDAARFSAGEELQEQEIQGQHHDSAADAAADDESPSLRDEGQDRAGADGDEGRRRYLEELLKAIGDDHPSQAVDRALEAGWGLEELAEEIQRVAEYNGAKIHSKAAWLRSMLPKGPDALSAALDRLGAPRRNGDGNGNDLQRLKSEYSDLLAELLSEGTPPERRKEIEARGRAVRAELEERGFDVESYREELLRGWGLVEEEAAEPKVSGDEMNLRAWLKQEGVSSIAELVGQAAVEA